MCIYIYIQTYVSIETKLRCISETCLWQHLSSAVAVLSSWLRVFKIQFYLTGSYCIFVFKMEKTLLFLIFGLTMLSHAQGMYMHAVSKQRLKIKILHCHPVVKVGRV